MKLLKGFFTCLCFLVFFIPIFGTETPIDLAYAGEVVVTSTTSRYETDDKQVARAFNTKIFPIIRSVDNSNSVDVDSSGVNVVSSADDQSGTCAEQDVLYPLSLSLALLYCLFLVLLRYFDSKKDAFL